MSNKPLDEIARICEDEILSKGFHYLQKFSCKKCGQRLTMDILDILFYEGECDKCGFVTDIREEGCGLVMITDPSLMVEKGILRWPEKDDIIHDSQSGA